MEENEKVDALYEEMPEWAREPEAQATEDTSTQQADDDKRFMDELMKASRLMRQRQRMMGDEQREAQQQSRERQRALKMLELKPEMTQKEMAELMGVRLRALDELLASLEEQGLVVRVQPDEPDMRIVSVALSEEGQASLAAEQPDNEAPSLTPGFAPEDRADLLDLLQVLNASLEALGLRDEDRGFRGGGRGGRERGGFEGRGDRRAPRGGFGASRDARGSERGGYGKGRDDRREGRGGFRGKRDERNNRHSYSARYERSDRRDQRFGGRTRGGFGGNRGGRGFGSSN